MHHLHHTHKYDFKPDTINYFSVHNDTVNDHQQFIKQHQQFIERDPVFNILRVIPNGFVLIVLIL